MSKSFHIQTPNIFSLLNESNDEDEYAKSLQHSPK